MSAKSWISWEAGVNLIATTGPEIETPNAIIHVARVVHTPVGSAPCGMIFWQPDPAASPLAFGFVSTNDLVADYLADHIFAGTPFQGAPYIKGKIEVEIGENHAIANVEILGKIFRTELSDFAAADLIHRTPTPSAPFYQQGIEAVAGKATLTVNDQAIDLVIPPVSITGGPCAFFAATGLYAR